VNFTNLDRTDAYRKLKDEYSAGTERLLLPDILSEERITTYSIAAGGGLTYNYAAKQVDDSVLNILSDLAAETGCIEKYRALAAGERMNTGEDRRVLHHLTRGELIGPVSEADSNLGAFYREQQQRIAEFSRRVRSGEITGSTGKSFSTVVQIGIGGSDLGPRALYLALKNWCRTELGPPQLAARFISNVDPDDAEEVLHSLDLERTLFILVSKSGTTQETLTNRTLVTEMMRSSGIPGLNPERHFVAVTSQTSPLAKSPGFLDSFFIDDYIGGRYSSTSAVGGVVLSLAFGPKIFERLLAGAHEADKAAMEKDFHCNAALTDALIGVWERNICGFPVSAILPYSQGLHRFPAHLQQLDMESNGKQVNRDGEPLGYSTGPVIFGEPGTNGQHSFYQLLHQGTDIVPLQFIGFIRSQTGYDTEYEGSTSQQKLKANLTAQIVAFAAGKENSNLNKNFPGGRPSSLIYADQLTPEALGALLAHFENKVMFQGFIWNINSFDQEGVQLGKILTNQVLGAPEKRGALLNAYARLLKL
jgi:glucose-6-phosphate isomerase